MSEGKGEEKAEGDPFCVAEENAGAGGESLVEMVQNYFYTDESFQTVFEKFCDDHWDVIDTSSDEHRLEYTDSYNAFQKLYEKKIEEYILSKGFEVDDFYEELCAAPPDSEMDFFRQIMTAVCDYDVFFAMMKETALRKKRAVERDRIAAEMEASEGKQGDGGGAAQQAKK